MLELPELDDELLDKRFRRLLPLSVPFLAVTLLESPLLESPLLLALVLALLDFTGLRPRVLVVRFFSLSLRGAGERERLLRPIPNADTAKISAPT